MFVYTTYIIVFKEFKVLRERERERECGSHTVEASKYEMHGNVFYFMVTFLRKFPRMIINENYTILHYGSPHLPLRWNRPGVY